eukprot:7145182-Alexandrium_andersonii.AAC.1
MSASLVGSEMCIRDSPTLLPCDAAPGWGLVSASHHSARPTASLRPVFRCAVALGGRSPPSCAPAAAP